MEPIISNEMSNSEKSQITQTFENQIQKLNNTSNNEINNETNTEIEHFLKDISVKKYKKIYYGDLVLIYESRDSIKYFTLEKGKVFQNKYGSFNHDDLLGKSYGFKIKSTKSDGYITILEFIPNLWERCINKLTQILFNPDISMIMTFLNIRSDSIIYESGTGSGCLSTNMSSVLSEGHLYTFEFNQERALKLKNLFQIMGLNKKITVTHRDVVEGGFEVEAENLYSPEHSKCDGIFIDLPSPWLIIEKAKNVLLPGGSFVSFSPCIEQIDKTMRALKENEFINPRVFECPYRTHNYSRTVKIQMPVINSKRKFGQQIQFHEEELNISNNRVDMRGHTGFLIYATNCS
jgi:tRNA (adenine57-N1/adenine58-N1)-methyltransferase